MSDTAALVERLRERRAALVNKTEYMMLPSADRDCAEAADTIERQQSELSSIRERTIEQCANVAERIWFDARDTDWDAGVNSGKRAIAKAIRSLSRAEIKERDTNEQG